MSSPSESFEELWQRLRAGRGLTNTGDDPVYYLVFKPEQMLEIKRLQKQWAARLAKQGWTDCSNSPVSRSCRWNRTSARAC